MKKFLVTGGCGFIGSHLVDALVRQGHHVRVLDDMSTGRRENLDPAAELRVGDIGDRQTVKDAMKDMDGCYHLAAIASVDKSVSDWTGCHRVNLTGSINVFDAASTAAAGRKIPVVYASSAAVYGDSAMMPLSEKASTRPMTAYGADKLGSEQHARVAGLIHQVPTTGFRFFNVYGPRQDPKSPYSGVISIFADRVMAGEAVKIFGDGQQVRDFVFVSDVVAFLQQGMANASTAARVFNVCTGTGTNIIQLARSMAAVNGCTLNVEFEPVRQGDIRVSLGDPRLAKEELGLAAQVPLGTGLKQTIAHLRDSEVIAA
jgi:UDP-glucose 4-epimerase